MNWEKLNEREKRMVLIGGLAAFVLLYLFAFLLPTLEDIHKQKHKIPLRQIEAADIQKQLNLLYSYPKTREYSGDYLAELETLSEAIGVKEKMTYRPLGEDKKEAELKLDDMSCEEFVRFLYGLKKAGIPIKQLNMQDFEGDNLWNIKITLGG